MKDKRYIRVDGKPFYDVKTKTFLFDYDERQLLILRCGLECNRPVRAIAFPEIPYDIMEACLDAKIDMESPYIRDVDVWLVAMIDWNKILNKDRKYGFSCSREDVCAFITRTLVSIAGNGTPAVMYKHLWIYDTSFWHVYHRVRTSCGALRLFKRKYIKQQYLNVLLKRGLIVDATNEPWYLKYLRY